MTPDEIKAWAQNNPDNPKAQAILSKMSGGQSAPAETSLADITSGGELGTPSNPGVDALKQQRASILQQIQSLPPTSKNYIKGMSTVSSISSTIEKMMKPPAKDPNAESESQIEKKEGLNTVGKNLSYMMEVLNQIEPGEGILSRPTGWVQRAGYHLGMNPEVGQYESLINSLVGPVARSMSGEKGPLSDGDIERGKSVFPEIEGTQQDRAAKIESLIELLNNATGKDWRSELKAK